MTLPNRNDVLGFDFGWQGGPFAEVLSRGEDVDPDFGWQGQPFWPAPSATPTIQLRTSSRANVRGKSATAGTALAKLIVSRNRTGIRAQSVTARFYTAWNSNDTYGLATVTPTRFVSGGGTAAARARDGKASGKYYVEFQDTGFYGSGDSGYGFATLGQSLSTWGTSDATNGFGIFLVSDVRVNGSVIRSPWGAFLLGGARHSFAVDLDSKLFWIRRNGGPWQGAVSGVADPETGLNGFDFSAVTSAIYPVVSSGIYAPYLDAYFGDEPQSAPPPTGFKPGWPRNDTAKFTLSRGRVDVRGKGTFALLSGKVLTGNGRIGLRSRSTAFAFNSITLITGQGWAAVRSSSAAGVASFSSALDARGRMGFRSTSDLTAPVPIDLRRPVVVALNP